MQSGLIKDNIIEVNRFSNALHSTSYSPQSSRLDTSQLYGWLPYVNSMDSNVGVKAPIIFNFEDFMTLEGIDIQQGDLNDVTIFNKIRFSARSYWNPETIISYGETEKSGDGDPLVCFMFYLSYIFFSIIPFHSLFFCNMYFCRNSLIIFFVNVS